MRTETTQDTLQGRCTSHSTMKVQKTGRYVIQTTAEMQVAVIRQMCGSAAPHFQLIDIFKATKLPEKKKFQQVTQHSEKEKETLSKSC